MANVVYIATSLDGYIARSDGGIDWLTEVPNPDNSDYGFGEFMKRIDCILMGRKTFETVAGFGAWPYEVPVFILSRSIADLPPEYRDRARIVNGELTTILQGLQEEGFRNFYIDGGETIQSFLEKDLIDEMIITRIPILLGSGIPLFREMDSELRFELSGTELLGGQLVKSHYRRKSKGT